MSTPGRKFEVEAMFCTWFEISHTNNKTDRGASNVCLGFSSVREHKLNAPLKDVQPRWLSNGIVEYVDSMHRNLCKSLKRDFIPTQDAAGNAAVLIEQEVNVVSINSFP